MDCWATLRSGFPPALRVALRQQTPLAGNPVCVLLGSRMIGCPNLCNQAVRTQNIIVTSSNKV